MHSAQNNRLHETFFLTNQNGVHNVTLTFFTKREKLWNHQELNRIREIQKSKKEREKDLNKEGERKIDKKESTCRNKEKREMSIISLIYYYIELILIRNVRKKHLVVVTPLPLLYTRYSTLATLLFLLHSRYFTLAT